MEATQMLNNAIQQMLEKLELLNQKLDQSKKEPLTGVWLDNQETCQVLKISKRTLQVYRDNGLLPYSQVGGKIYFRITDIEDHLQRHYVKASNRKR
jgi:hypothetical protein